jgi:threonine dehydratase
MLKCENRQRTGAFKEGGAANVLLQLSNEERSRNVMAASAGNHAQALAYHSSRLGIRTTLVMPTKTPTVKVQRTQEFGGHVMLAGDDFESASAIADAIASRDDLLYVHPFDDVRIIAGQGTIGLEVCDDWTDAETIVVPVGGGGLISGVAVAVKSLRPAVDIIGVRMTKCIDSSDARSASRAATESRLADGIDIKSIGSIARAIIDSLVDRIVTVTETDVRHAMYVLAEYEKMIVEGAGASGLAAVLAHPAMFRGKRIAVLVTGGNVDLLTFTAAVRHYASA